jgi:UDP-N-acetylmuramoyl-tripeptide--D-alanyl-D-alanine ligase
MQIESLYNIYLEHPNVQTDTRKLRTGDLFFALKGGNFNGNHFAQQAIETGAAMPLSMKKTLKYLAKLFW